MKGGVDRVARVGLIEKPLYPQERNILPVKVLVPGRDQKGWSGEFKCTGEGNEGGGCGALLLVEEGDIYKTFRHCRDEKDTFLTFQCPSCGVETDLKLDGKSKPPSRLLSSAPTRASWLDRSI